MKKILAFLLSVTLIFTLSACKKDEPFEDEEVLFDITTQSSPNSSEEVTAGEVSSDENSLGENSSDEVISNETSSGESSSSESSSSESSSSEASSSGTSDLNPTVNTPEEDVFDTGMELVSGGGVYFPDINRYYTYAAEIYADLKNFTFSYDEQLGSFPIVIDGSMGYYWRVNDDRFDSVADLENYLNSLFTEECKNTFYDPTRFIDYEGHLYASIGAVADNYTYAGCSFVLTKQTTKRILFTGTSYSYKNYEEVDSEVPLFTTVPEDVSKYLTRTVDFEMQVSEDGMSWRFSKFGYIG